jgi:hypothetical protein
VRDLADITESKSNGILKASHKIESLKGIAALESQSKRGKAREQMLVMPKLHNESSHQKKERRQVQDSNVCLASKVD